MSELDDLRDHLERYRAVTMQALDLVTDEELAWRPGPDQYSLGQQFLHIAQSEDLQIHGLLQGDWDFERGRFPNRDLTVDEVRELLNETRERTVAALSGLSTGSLDEQLELGEGRPVQTLRWWLWLQIEHEVHHKAQIAVYLRQMGKIPPFFAEALEDGARPDMEVREKMGGFRGVE